MNALIPAVELLKASSEQPLRCALDMNTSSVLPPEQFDFFRSWYAGIAEVTLFQEECSSFLAHQMVWDFGKLTFIYLTLPYCQFGWRHLSRPTIDNWYLTLLLPKAQDSRDDFEARDLGLQSFANPFEYISKKTDFLAFVLPRNLHFIQSSTIEIRRNSKQLLTDYMLLLHRSLPHLRSTDALNIAAATTSLLAACLAPSRDRIAEAQRPIEAVLMNRASQIIAKRLSDPKLTPDLLCREIGVSRSGLYRIFESVGGVANYIRRARLCKTRDALADSSDGRSIFAIAEQYGFMDPSTYSRMFKKEFGISPRDARTEGWLNLKFARPTDRTPTLRNLLLGNYWDRSNDVDRL